MKRSLLLPSFTGCACQTTELLVKGEKTGKEDRKELQSNICLLIYLDTIFQASVRATDHKPASFFLPCIRDYAPELRPALATLPPQKRKLPQPLFSACPSRARALSISSPSVTALFPLPGLAAEIGWFGNRYTEGQVPHQGHTGFSVPLMGGWEPGDILESSWVLAKPQDVRYLHLSAAQREI